jgi:hypothetical protein
LEQLEPAIEAATPSQDLDLKGCREMVVYCQNKRTQTRNVAKFGFTQAFKYKSQQCLTSMQLF